MKIRLITTKEAIQPMFAAEMPEAIMVAAHLMKPLLASAVASAIRPPIQNMASQAPFSERTSFQVSTLVISMIETASMAMGVAPILVMLPVAQSTRHITNTKASTFSSNDIGPILASSSLAS